MNQIADVGPVINAGADQVDGPRPNRFALALGAIVVLGIVARVVFIIGWAWGSPLHGDPLFFQQSAAHLADGKGYVDQFIGRGPLVPTAEHPPAFTALLAGLDLVHVRSADAHRIALACISALGVFVMGLLGRRVAGPAVGLLAAGVAALDPVWVQWSGFLMSESLYLIVVPALLLFAFRFLDRRNPWDLFVLGLLIGLATLTRSEAIDFVVLFGLLVVFLIARPWRERLMFAVVFLAGIGIVLTPWLIRNDVQMGSLTLSTNQGLTLTGSYAGATFSPANRLYGSFDDEAQFITAAVFVRYLKPPGGLHHWTEASLSKQMESGAITYARGHLSDLPGVVLAREGRAWGLYSPGTQLRYDTDEDTTGARGPKQAQQIVNWVLLPFACLGAVVLGRRSKGRLLVLVVPVVVVVVNVGAFYGSTRLRLAAEPSIDVLAAIGAVAAGTWIAAHRRRSSAEDDLATSVEQPMAVPG